MKPLVSTHDLGYGSAVAANSATGFGDPITVRRTSAPLMIAGAFFVPAHPVYGGCARETFESAGCLTSRFANLRTAATLNRLATIRGSSSTLGATPMLSHLFQLTPEQIRNKIARHRAMAIAQLRSKSSLKVRTERYNAQMARARFFEAMLAGGAK